MDATPGGAAALVPCIIEYVGLLLSHGSDVAIVRAALEFALRCADNPCDMAAIYSSYSAVERAAGNLDKASAVRWRGAKALDARH